MKSLIVLALLCSLSLAAKVPSPHQWGKPQDGGAVCTLCTDMVKVLETYLIGDHTEQEAIAYLENVSI